MQIQNSPKMATGEDATASGRSPTLHSVEEVLKTTDEYRAYSGTVKAAGTLIAPRRAEPRMADELLAGVLEDAAWF